jgi:hypothetical protein
MDSYHNGKCQPHVFKARGLLFVPPALTLKKSTALPTGCIYFSQNKTTIISQLLGFWALSIVWYSKKIREQNVSETGSVSVLR